MDIANNGCFAKSEFYFDLMDESKLYDERTYTHTLPPLSCTKTKILLLYHTAVDDVPAEQGVHAETPAADA